MAAKLPRAADTAAIVILLVGLAAAPGHPPQPRRERAPTSVTVDPEHHPGTNVTQEDGLVVWQVEPPTAKPVLNATLTGSPSRMSIAMMRGECEHRQIVLAAANGAAELRNIRVHADADNVTPPGLGARWSFKQVGYVNCTANADFRGTTDGWFPDILLPQQLAAGTAAGGGGPGRAGAAGEHPAALGRALHLPERIGWKSLW
eukprot:COSAG01_NODE_18400_length_1078_cov_1.302349_1_plen_203_part_00